MKRLSLKDQVIVTVLKNIQVDINLGLAGEYKGRALTQTEKLKFLFRAHDDAEKLEKEIQEGRFDNLDV